MGGSSSEDSITGTVFDDRGSKLGGAIVTCNGMTTRTLFDGSYRFHSLPDGTHIVETHADGFVPGSQEIVVKKGAKAAADFRLQADTGNAAICGHVIDRESGEPIPRGGAVFMVRHISNEYASIDPMTGYFEFTNLPPGEYFIWTSVLEYQEENRSILLGRDEIHREDLHLEKVKRKEAPWG